MTTKFTRTVTTYKAVAYKEVWNDGIGTREEFASVEYDAASTNNTDARAALVAAGFKCPRGTYIEIVPVAEKKYSIDLDTFVSIAELVEVKNL